jgi:hypothetical protein
MQQHTVVGFITEEVINLLSLDAEPNTPIYIGETNIEHMQSDHSDEYQKYGKRIPSIIANADYVRLKEDDNSIEYVRKFGKYLKLAVRISSTGDYFARSLYFISKSRADNLIKKGELKPLTKQ